ncbi:unnamed protein product [Spodoptera exigua]|nr:unnamed protein product [Spodoptera exigua]
MGSLVATTSTFVLKYSRTEWTRESIIHTMVGDCRWWSRFASKCESLLVSKSGIFCRSNDLKLPAMLPNKGCAQLLAPTYAPHERLIQAAHQPDIVHNWS